MANNFGDEIQHLKTSFKISENKEMFANLISNTDNTLMKIEDELLSVADNAEKKWCLGPSFTALDIILGVTLQRLHTLGFASMLSNKPGLSEFWKEFKLRPTFQEIFQKQISLIETGVNVEEKGAGKINEDMSSEDSSSDITSAEPSSSGIESKQTKVQSFKSNTLLVRAQFKVQ